MQLNIIERVKIDPSYRQMLIKTRVQPSSALLDASPFLPLPQSSLRAPLLELGDVFPSLLLKGASMNVRSIIVSKITRYQGHACSRYSAVTVGGGTVEFEDTERPPALESNEARPAGGISRLVWRE